MIIRRIEEKDNEAMAEIVRECLTEYGAAGRMDTAWGDPCLNCLSTVYVLEKNAYWVAENEEGKIIAGVGVGILEGVTETCELQKMYCLKEYRGTGVAQKLLETALEFAERYYDSIYLETLDNMDRAKRFYERNGFAHTKETIGETGHGGCDFHYIKKLVKA